MTNDSTIIKRSRRSGFITSLQKFWTVFHFFLVYSISRFIDTFSEVTDSGSDTASQQSNFFEISILLEVSGRWYFCKDLSSLGSVLSITNISGIPFYGLWRDLQFQRLCITFYPFPPACCGLLSISIPNCKMYKKNIVRLFFTT